MNKKVTKIEPIRHQILKELKPKKRVCGYCRVSTDSTKQHTSYMAQTEYYESYIQKQSEWEFAGIFADESSGTKVKNRDGFHQMISECERGNIDLILTKSVTRFARNTVDSIKTVRYLKSLGVSIYFEKENINTMSEQSEQMLTILSSVAQGESENISQNSKWGVQKRFRDGSFKISCAPYGYKKDDNGDLIINYEESLIIRRIFNEYLNGKGSYAIAKMLTQEKIPTIKTSKKWNDSVVKELLHNPVYCGELLLQKTYTTESLPFTKKKNHGELQKFSIKDNHEPIITEEEFKMVHEIYEYRRKQAKIDDSGKNLNRYEFSSKILCAECGGTFRRQKIYIGKPYERVQWCCVNHIERIELCGTKAVREENIKETYLLMWNKLVSNHEEILTPLLGALKGLHISKEQEIIINDWNKKIEEINEQSQILSRVMHKGYMDSAIFMQEQMTLEIELQEYRKKRDGLLEANRHQKEINGTMRLLQIIRYNPSPLDDYQEELLSATVDKIIIGPSGEITFRLINGLHLKEYTRK